MHLKSLRVQNFRSLKQFDVSKLGRVNLIVGKNNSGKSSVLEALRVYACAADPYVLNDIAVAHDELFWLPESDRLKDSIDMPYEHFFTGREFPKDDNAKIVIEDYGNGNAHQGLSVEHVYIKTAETVQDVDGESITKKTIHIVPKHKVADENADFDDQALSISRGDHKKLIPFSRPPMPRRYQVGHNDILPCSYVPTQFVDMDELASIWDEVQFSEHGDFVKEGLKIIAEDFENIAFVNSDSDKPRLAVARRQGVPSRRTAKIKLKGTSKAIPLNSMGEGMSRVLQLLLKISPAKGGFLLIDEFENGLHYSIQKEIWTYLFDFAERLNIQIFATTHSWDCVEAFAQVAKEKQATEGVLFRVGKSIRTSNKGDVIATVFDEHELFDITQADVEVR